MCFRPNAKYHIELVLYCKVGADKDNVISKQSSYVQSYMCQFPETSQFALYVSTISFN